MSENGIPLSEAVIPRVEKAMPADFPDEPFLGLDDIEAHTTRLLGLKTSASMKSAAKRFYPGDVLYSRLRPYLNKVWLADRSGLCSSEFIVLPANKDFDGAFLKYRLNAMDFVSFANSLNTGDRPRVDFDQIGSFRLPAFSISYQKRIVAKIEELFSELEAGEESLRVARRQLGVYRQSLLKQAFEGHLTAKWRTQNPAKLESPGASDVSADELEGFAELPSGWRYTRFGRFIRHIDAGKSFRCEERRPRPEEIGVAKVSAVTWGEYDEAESKTCIDPEKVNPSYFIRPGDFILSRANTIELVGASVIVRHVTQKVMLSDKTLRLTMDDALKPFFLQYLRSRQGRREIEKRSTGNQESMRNIGQDRIRSIIVPECSLPEQQEIVRLLDEQFEVIERNEREIDGALRQSEALRQAILQKAFTGRLVPQVATDEPAVELLARIRADQEAATTAKSRPRKAAGTGDWFPEVAGAKKKPKKSRITRRPGTTDLQAGIVALAIDRFGRRKQFLGHTNAEKIVHLADCLAGLQLDRHPVKDAAGPNDFKRAKEIEHRASAKGWFRVTKDGPVYHYHAGRNLPALLNATRRTLGPKIKIIENLLEHLRGMDTRAIEIFATVYAAWNNLLLRQAPLSDEAIVTEARENWHKQKLEISRKRFFDAIAWMKQKGFVPQGTGHLVDKPRTA